MKRTIGFLLTMSLAGLAAAADDDRDQAKRIADWQRQAVYGAKHGPQVVAWAQYNLGVSYLNGEGVPRDEAEAIWWIRNSAQRSYAPAQYLLATLYQEGRGVEQSYDEAVFWFRTAASREHGGAQYRLSQMYADGIGVRKNLQRAAFWRRRFVEAGYRPADLGIADVAAGR